MDHYFNARDYWHCIHTQLTNLLRYTSSVDYQILALLILNGNFLRGLTVLSNDGLQVLENRQH